MLGLLTHAVHNQENPDDHNHTGSSPPSSSQGSGAPLQQQQQQQQQHNSPAAAGAAGSQQSGFMAGFAQFQHLKAKLKPYRKHAGHYVKSPEVRQLLQENAAACHKFMQGKDTTELSTIITKVLMHWAECLYALARKFGERKMLIPACEKYEVVAKYTGGKDDYSVYCKWGNAECEKSLYNIFYKDGKGKKALYRKGEEMYKKGLGVAGNNPVKRSNVLYSWGVSLFRYARSCEPMCSSKEVYSMYQRAGRLLYDAYQASPTNKQAIHKWGKVLDSQALIISHKSYPDLHLEDDVELFLIVYSSLAMRGKLKNLKALIALCLSPEETTQARATEVLEHLSNFLDTSTQIPTTPRSLIPPTPRSPPRSPTLTSPPPPSTPPDLVFLSLDTNKEKAGNDEGKGTEGNKKDSSEDKLSDVDLSNGKSPEAGRPKIPSNGKETGENGHHAEPEGSANASYDSSNSLEGAEANDKSRKEASSPFAQADDTRANRPNVPSLSLSSITGPHAIAAPSPLPIPSPPAPTAPAPKTTPLFLELSLSGSSLVPPELASPSMDEVKANQLAIMEEAKATLAWIKQIIVQNHTLTITTKIQALKSLGEEGQRIWRESKIKYQDALDNFEIFANCLNFHTRRQLAHLQKYLTAPDPSVPIRGGTTEGDSSSDLSTAASVAANAENPQPDTNTEHPTTRQRSRSFSRAKSDYEHLFIHEDINKYYSDFVKIGRGGFGDVFTAKSRTTGATVALKTMRRNFEEHYKQIGREIMLMKSCVHPNIVNFIESYICHDHVWIVMEYCDGGSLRHFASCAILEESHISYISKQILQGLDYMHKEHRIHRDIKADNILLNLDASVKIADMGIATDLDDPETPTELMSLCGSKYWMAPEMIKFQPYNYKVDIWSFGGLLIELAEGRHPFEGRHSMAAMFLAATQGADQLTEPEKWSDAFLDFFAQTTQMNPALRPSAEDLLKHEFIVMFDTLEQRKAIKDNIIWRLEQVFVGYQLGKILF